MRGTFENDEKMPLHGLAVNEAAMAYLDWQFKIAEAKKMGSDSVYMGQGQSDMALAAADKQRRKCLANFWKVVEEEIKDRNPAAGPHEIRMYGSDVLRSLAKDTSAVTYHYR